MAAPRACMAQWARGSLSASFRPHYECLNRPAPFVQQSRGAILAGGTSANAAKYKRNKIQAQAAKKKKGRTHFIEHDLRQAEQFSLCDAMRYIQAFEVGYPPSSPKYEVHLKLRTLKNGPVVRNRMRLPYPVKTDLRIAVICAPDSKYADAARKAGASLVGEEEIFNAVKEGKIEFDRCICQTDSMQKLQKAGIARILGPRGLMPSPKTGSVAKDVASLVRDMVGGSEYRERDGVVRIAVGQLGFSPDKVKSNIKAFVENVKKDIAGLSDRINKELHEVVLSSTHSPGFSLNGEFRSSGVSEQDITPDQSLAGDSAVIRIPPAAPEAPTEATPT